MSNVKAAARRIVSRDPEHPSHPLGSRAKILLSSIFGPYARDDEFGSRVINPMELWHNQVTRQQGPFSVRMFHRSWGLMFIQANVEARCTLLDFPSLDRFIEEIRDSDYDIVGISGIVPNVGKVRKMCQLVRQYLPKAGIVVGGHIAGLPELSELIDADHIVYGEGVSWFRRYCGEDVGKPFRHPQIESSIGRRTMGMDLPHRDVRTSEATLIPSVGCPMGCNFCATSAMFGGKGKSVEFFSTAAELFSLMRQLEAELKVGAFFVMDENFLLNRKRAMELLHLMREHDKAWSLYVFSSANALAKYTTEELAALGVSWVWLGLEGKGSQYGKLAGTDSIELVARLQDHGVRVLGSTIIGLEEHTPENIDQAIQHAVDHDCDFHQFMLYTAVAGTPLYAQQRSCDNLLAPERMKFEDTHGQLRFNFNHSSITEGAEEEYLLRSFNEDYRINGPSVLRVVRTTLKGWRRYRDHPDSRIGRRFKMQMEGMRTFYPAALWAAMRWFKDNPPLVARLGELYRDICGEFGLLPRLCGPLFGRLMLRSIRREAKRLDGGWTTEPPTFYERNYETGDPADRATLIKTVAATVDEPIATT